MKVFGMSKVAVALLVSLCGVAALASPPESGYHLIKKVPLGKAAGGAEYFDAATVVVFDMKSLKKTGEIKSYPDTDAIIYDPASNLIFTFNGDSKNSTVIDPAKETVVKALDLGGAPEQAVPDGKGIVFDNIAESNEVAVIDTHSLTIKSRWKVAPAGEPVAITLDQEHRRLFSAGRGPALLVMMDADSGKVLESFPISEGVDSNVFDPDS